MHETPSNPIVLYDGVCGLCNSGVRFLLKRDRRDQLRFASLQSDFAIALLRRHGMDASRLDTLYVLEEYGRATENLLARADAVLFLARAIGEVWTMLRLLKILPKWVRERVYNLVARHRYRFFGKYESCSLLDGWPQQKFLG